MESARSMKSEEIRDGVEKIKTWVSGGIDKDAILFAEKFGSHLAYKDRGKDQSLSTAQIRNVFGEVRRIQMKIKQRYNEAPILLLRPKLAYAAKRADRRTVYDLSDVLSAGLVAVVDHEDEEKKQERFENFANFFEAVLAYHKAYGGK